MGNASKNEAYALDMRSVSKRFPGTLAVDKVDFRVRAGEVHALMGAVSYTHLTLPTN